MSLVKSVIFLRIGCLKPWENRHSHKELQLVLSRYTPLVEVNKALSPWSNRQLYNKFLGRPARQSNIRFLNSQVNILNDGTFVDFSILTAMTFVICQICDLSNNWPSQASMWTLENWHPTRPCPTDWPYPDWRHWQSPESYLHNSCPTRSSTIVESLWVKRQCNIF